MGTDAQRLEITMFFRKPSRGVELTSMLVQPQVGEGVSNQTPPSKALYDVNDVQTSCLRSAWHRRFSM